MRDFHNTMPPNLHPKQLLFNIAETIDGALVRTSLFRRFAPQSPPAPAATRLRIAVVSLIPLLGDSVMLYPLIDAIRRENPDAEISVFAAGAGRVLSLHPDVDHFYLYRPVLDTEVRYSFLKYFGTVKLYNYWQAWRAHYKNLQFDICFVPRGGVDPYNSAHMAWMLGGQIRAGYSRALEPEFHDDDWNEDQLFTSLVRTSEAHEVERGSAILVKAGVIRSGVNIHQPVAGMISVANSEEGRRYIANHPQLADRYAIIAPGASHARRCWTPEGFAELANTEMLERGILPVFVGAPAERELCQFIAKRLNGPSLELTGTTFPELVALTAGAEFFLGNDTGTGHVAGSVGTPVVEASPYALSNRTDHHASPVRSRPCGPYVAVVQPEFQLPPCIDQCGFLHEAHCINQVSAAQMRNALNELLVRRDGDRAALLIRDRAGLGVT